MPAPSPDTAPEAALAARLFPNGGQMGALIRTHDWAQSSLGPMSGWPLSLRTAVSIMLGSRFPMMVHWGPELVHFYNDGYAAILQTKHPGALGQPAHPWWSEMWTFLTPIFKQVWAGETTYYENQLTLPNRQGFVEETYFTFSHSPIRDEEGQVGGIFVTALETTATVVNQRRLAMLSHLNVFAALATDPAEAAQHLMAALATNPADIPFALLYLVDPAARLARLRGWIGLPAGEPTAPATIALPWPEEDAPAADRGWPLAEALRSGWPVLVSDLAARFGHWPPCDLPVPVTQALVLPLQPGDSGPEHLAHAVLVAGLSPRRLADDEYRAFFALMADYAGRALSHAAATHEAHHLNLALREANASLDTFVHIAAHDLRGPVTNLRGLLDVYYEEAPGPGRDRIMALLGQDVHRLAGTVTGLLEVLRSQHDAAAPPASLDLAALCAGVREELADYLHAQGGTIVVDFSQAETVVYPQAYLESILKNLLHNALKYHAPGRPPLVLVRSERQGAAVVLTVTDNGIGMDLARDRDRLFRPFSRLTSQAEGAGLGLHLVRTLVRQRGGSIEASSVLGEGTTFTVVLPEMSA